MELKHEKLMAFLDGEMSPAERREIEARVKASPELAAKLEEMQGTDRWLRDSFEGSDATAVRPDTMELVDQLAEKLAENPVGETHEHTGNVVDFADRKSAAGSFFRRPFGQQLMAASIALFLGFGAGFMLQESDLKQTQNALDYQGAGVVAQGSPLYAALEATPSLTTYRHGPKEELSATPLTTFRSTDGSFCREFVTSAPAASNRGIACRGDNAWVIKATIAVNAPGAGAVGEFVPATEESNPILDGMIMSMIAGDMLGSTQEANLIGTSWQPE